ncbi:SEC-C domain-containing protein [Chryseobacterium shandongense]|uniref:SEC-C domain-containing protein n=1 Tax=Chryseobacterium shandongense TaxID=1493872 RepID=A0AAD0YCC4_9FLAO|nr:SEC-C domain-containing protein [Chryseobacterium shandongense]AZA88691.1 SEC-C domain-containing protein [Chryseobacterium shandongense]AZA97232.1 SEC-C domain-containing protein [Chryseobacterium shandongense]
MEILGDLKKEVQEGNTPSEDRVKDFANKLFPMEAIVNLHYKTIIKGELLGNTISFDGRPHVGMKKAVTSESGMKGYLVEESEEEKSIYKWKDGNFTEADHELSALWRMTTTQADLLEQLKKSLKPDKFLKFVDFKELDKYVTEVLNDPNIQEFLLISLLENYDIEADVAVQIFGRWYQSGNPLIKEFAPYAFHCLRVDSLFLFGLTSGLIGTRPTNRVDLEYFYYLPFGNVFTSSDKFHKSLIPLLLREDQKFIVGQELKEDLKNIVTFLNTLKTDERKKYKNVPPIIESSFTFQLWKEFFNYPINSNWNRELSEAGKEMMKEKMQEFERALEGDSINLESGDDAEFIVKKSWLSKSDPCFCGSGKKVIDCCISNEKFNEIALEEIRKKIKKDIISSYSKADHVRFSHGNGTELPAIIFVYKISDLDPNGLNGLIRFYQNEELKISASLDGIMITISFIGNNGNENITLPPLPFNPRQLESFLEKKYSKISILDGLISPQNARDVIIIIPEEGAPPKQIIIKEIELYSTDD